MPYDRNDELPKGVKNNCTSKQQTMWRKVFNGAFDFYKEKGRANVDQLAAQTAWKMVVKYGGYKPAKKESVEMPKNFDLDSNVRQLMEIADQGPATPDFDLRTLTETADFMAPLIDEDDVGHLTGDYDTTGTISDPPVGKQEIGEPTEEEEEIYSGISFDDEGDDKRKRKRKYAQDDEDEDMKRRKQVERFEEACRKGDFEAMEQIAGEIEEQNNGDGDEDGKRKGAMDARFERAAKEFEDSEEGEISVSDAVDDFEKQLSDYKRKQAYDTSGSIADPAQNFDTDWHADWKDEVDFEDEITDDNDDPEDKKKKQDQDVEGGIADPAQGIDTDWHADWKAEDDDLISDQDIEDALRGRKGKDDLSFSDEDEESKKKIEESSLAALKRFINENGEEGDEKLDEAPVVSLHQITLERYKSNITMSVGDFLQKLYERANKEPSDSTVLGFCASLPLALYGTLANYIASQKWSKEFEAAHKKLSMAVLNTAQNLTNNLPAFAKALKGEDKDRGVNGYQMGIKTAMSINNRKLVYPIGLFLQELDQKASEAQTFGYVMGYTMTVSKWIVNMFKQAWRVARKMKGVDPSISQGFSAIVDVLEKADRELRNGIADSAKPLGGKDTFRAAKAMVGGIRKASKI